MGGVSEGTSSWVWGKTGGMAPRSARTKTKKACAKSRSSPPPRPPPASPAWCGGAAARTRTRTSADDLKARTSCRGCAAGQGWLKGTCGVCMGAEGWKDAAAYVSRRRGMRGEEEGDE